MMFGILEDHGDNVLPESPGRDHISMLTKTLPFGVAEVNRAL